MRESIAAVDLGESLNEVKKLIGEAIEDTRSLMFDLSPPILYEFGIEAAVEWLAEQIQQQHDIVCIVKDDKQPKPLDNDVSVSLFKAIRELLVNVIKHGQAHNVEISITRNNQDILVTVQDDGVGFDASAIHCHIDRTGGFGLFSMRERLGHLGGSVDINSAVGRGTRITLKAPLALKTNKQTVKGM